ncbi:MAG: hypothetical protein ACO1QB_01460 [Verrucomicrobiales bacterium]
MKTLEPPKHKRNRSFLRTVGPLLALIGLVFIAIGMISFFLAFGDMRPPKYFWCVFVGLPLLFVGGVMTQFGYIGSILRYTATETAPVAADTFNYMAEETKEGVKTVARAVAEGAKEGMKESGAPPKN